MSSTNRGAERRLDDAYMTPGWCVRRLLDVWTPPAGLLAEPCAGEGRIVKEIHGQWWTCDVRPVPGVLHVGDFLSITSWGPIGHVAAVVTNPPYSLAEEFIRHSRRSFPDAELVFLLRVAFLASAQRLALWRDIGAPDVYVLPNRPSFTGSGTDSADYAWFRWPIEKREAGCLRILKETSKEERAGRRTEAADVAAEATRKEVP